jgi:hypothetical protein
MMIFPQMASQQIASLQLSTAFDRIPVEIWGKIAQDLPTNSLSSFVLSSRKFYESANQYLYRTVYFFGTTKSNKAAAKEVYRLREPCFGIHRAQSWLSHSDHSSSINHLEAFFQTITARPELQSHITGVSFEWDNTLTAQDILIARKCLEYLNLNKSLSFLHLSLPDFDTKFPIMINVTFLEVVYPDENLLNDLYNDSQYDVNLQRGLRDRIYSIFRIPTLRHLSLKYARTWHAFDPLRPNDDSRLSTSNIISLSLPGTVPLSRDLEEILMWPKALRYIYHENVPGKSNFFQNHGTEQLASPDVFIKGLHSQRLTIEELIYNNGEDCCGNDETTFGQALREFVNLKRLSVTRDSLVGDGEDEEPQPLYETLPPNLEEAWIQLDSGDVYDHQQQLFLKQGLRGIATNKEQCCPSLKHIVLWMRNAQHGIYPSKYQVEASRILSVLYVLYPETSL